MIQGNAVHVENEIDMTSHKEKAVVVFTDTSIVLRAVQEALSQSLCERPAGVSARESVFGLDEG